MVLALGTKSYLDSNDILFDCSGGVSVDKQALERLIYVVIILGIFYYAVLRDN